jgi:collagenase-like PrtC family protease
VLSTLALIMNEREMALVRETVENTDFLVEANDISTAALLKGRPHAVGPFVNIYNEGTLAYMACNGAERVTLPVELAASSIAALAKSAPAELEVMVFGRLPLAISARCYHARCHNLSRDNCQFVCEKNPDGLDVDTLDGEPFLAVNGVQALSHAYCNMAGDLSVLRDLGIGRFRLSPHSGDMVRITEAFRAVLDNKMAPEEANAAIAVETGGMPLANGYFHGKAGAAFEGGSLM